MSFTKSVSQRLGNLKSINKQDSTLHAEATHGHLKVKLYSPNIFRVSATQDESFEDFSYSVIASPENLKIDWQDSSNQISIATSACKLVIDKNPTSISFQTLDGKIINEDDALGTS